MRKCTLTIIAGLALSATGLVTGLSSAAAADLDDYGVSTKDAPKYRAPESYSPARFYLRGDAGYGVFSNYTGYEAQFDLTDEKIDDSWAYSIGAGVYLTNRLRADLTYSWIDSADAFGFNPLNGGQSNETTLKSQALLFNAYYDLADRSSSFVPYVGVGLGWAFNETGTRKMYGCSSPCTFETQGERNTDIAAAAMVGFTRSITNAVKLDVGYRYLYLGDAITGAIDPARGAPMELRDISLHEFRVGMRVDIGRR